MKVWVVAEILGFLVYKELKKENFLRASYKLFEFETKFRTFVTHPEQSFNLL